MTLSTEKATFTCTLEGVTDGEDENVLYGVKLLGTSSVNGRDYLPEAMEAAVPLYEGAKACVDHPAKANDSRKYGEKLGRFRNVRYVAEKAGIFGDLQLNPENPTSRQLKWDAKHDPTSCGFSHNADIRVRRSTKDRSRIVVEGITKVRTVDLVFEPATTGGVFEHAIEESEDDEMKIEDLTLEQVLTRTDIVEAIEGKVRESKELADQKTALEQAQAEVERMKADEARRQLSATVVAELEAANLTLTDDTRVSLQERLEGMEDASDRKSLIDTFASVATAATESTRRSSAKANPPANATKADETDTQTNISEYLAGLAK